MAEITECTAADRDEFWQDTPQDVTGVTETGKDQDRAGGQVMDKQIIERAVEAAAKADYEVLRRGRWDEQPDDFRDEWRGDVRPMVTAALAEVESSLTAERDELRRWKEEALPVLSGLQNLGRALDVPLGERITGNVAAKRAEELAARVARVEALHVRTVFGYNAHCEECGTYWPCPTIKALRGESE